MIKAARLLLVIAVLGACTFTLAGGVAAAPAAGPPAGLTAAGRTLWNFEALLRQTFGTGYKGCLESLSRYVESFTKDSFCATHPSAETQYYFFAFAHPTGSAFHLVDRTFPAGAFGNYPAPIRVSGDYVACDRAGRTFLISYGDVAGLSANLACLEPN